MEFEFKTFGWKSMHFDALINRNSTNLGNVGFILDWICNRCFMWQTFHRRHKTGNKEQKNQLWLKGIWGKFVECNDEIYLEINGSRQQLRINLSFPSFKVYNLRNSLMKSCHICRKHLFWRKNQRMTFSGQKLKWLWGDKIRTRNRENGAMIMVDLMLKNTKMVLIVF